MIVTTFSKEGTKTISLPQKVTGQYWLYGTDGDSLKRLVSVEGINDNWMIKSNRQYKVLDANGNAVKSAYLHPLSFYVIFGNSSEKFFIFSESKTEDRQVFTKFISTNDVDLFIGRSELNDISYENDAVSSRHATLYSRGGTWYLQDENSTNGTFVNERRVEKCELNIGDMIYIMGLKIVIGKSFIALNDPDGMVRVSNKLSVLINQPVQQDPEEYEYELPEEEVFYRAPRFKRDIEKKTFRIDSPPSSPIGDEMPWLLVIGSSMAMGMMSLVTLVTAIISKNVTSMVMGGAMLVGTLLLPMITRRYETKRKRKKEAKRQKKYREYLDSVAVQINEECELQAQILNENSVTIQNCEDRILKVRANLWERSTGQNDFLRVRLGTGKGMLEAELQYQGRRFTLDDDNLQEELLAICERPKELHDIPITYSLFEDPASGVIGDRNRVIRFAQGMIVQLAALYSYDEVKFVVFYDETERSEFEFVKWLPHVWSDDYRFRYVATNANEVKEVSAYFENLIAVREAVDEKDMDTISPQFIIFSMNKKLATRAEMIKKLLAQKKNLHISIVEFYDKITSIDKECSMVVDLTDSEGRLYDKNDISGKSTAFHPDIYPDQNLLELSTQLANVPLDTIASGFKLPKTLTFLEMFGVGKVEHLNALTRWKENDPTKSLEVPIGVDSYGELFKLDLHERFHGPHGLVAGMTGSGKSEFIISYILSLAVNYHPNEVAFILIDYKGGGMAKSFETLPHTAGIITNLDGAAIKRSLVSIESELKRRQAIFAEASKLVEVSNIDIYKYQKMYREGIVQEPLQHLFIISDEFAELKTQQPEFMTQLVSAARIGRSLGVHLILATQKPSGVVDDQIWSNSKFKICLKVQERADSMDMLKRPDAAELTDTGRFYLQVGYNELFEMGQSAWAGAPYFPSDVVQKEKDHSVTVIDMNGHPLKEIKLDKKRGMMKDAKKQLDVITDYLKNTAEEEGIRIRPLWLEPIPAVILLDELRMKYNTGVERFVLNPVIGEYDDPSHQRQDVLRLPISAEGNAIIYGSAGSGKTTFLNAMIYSLITEHTPEEVNLYVLDFAAETLRAFAQAPHVGDVLLSYEEEKVNNLFKMLFSEVSKRKKLFADYGGDYSSYIRNSGSVLPSIVVAISNVAAFMETYEEHESSIAFLSREGTKYGIYFVLTALGFGDVRFRLMQSFKQLITLQMNDESDYSSIVGKTDGLVPSKYKGRGLIKTDEIYEFQTASLTSEDVPFMFIQEQCRRIRAQWSGQTARRIPILPKVVDSGFLRDYVSPEGGLKLPIGVETNSLNVNMYPFDDSLITMVLSAGDEFREFVADLSAFIGRYSGVTGCVFDMPKSITETCGTLKLCNSTKLAEEEISVLFDQMVYRNNTYKDSIEAGIECEHFEKIVVVINSMSLLRESVGEEANEKLSLILEKGSVEYGIHFIIGEQTRASSTVFYENWYKSNVSENDGIWIGDGATDQYQLKISKSSQDVRGEIPSGFGFSLIRGKTIKVKLLRERVGGDEDE